MPAARARTTPDRSATARSTALLTAGLLLAAGLGACSTGGSGPERSTPAAASAARPDTRASAAPLLTDVINRINERGSVRSSIRGDLGFVGDLDGEGVTRYTADGSDVSLRGHTRPAPGQRARPVELTVLDGVGYVKSPLLQAEPGKPWLRIAPDGTDFAAKLLAPALRQLQDSADPRATFGGIEHATKIQSSSPDQVGGQPATHYSLRVLTGPAAAAAPDEQQRKRLQKAAAGGQPEVGYELWIGPDGLPLKFAAAQQVAQAGQVSLETTYRDWGAPADIHAPAAEEIGAFPDGPPPQAQPPR